MLIRRSSTRRLAERKIAVYGDDPSPAFQVLYARMARSRDGGDDTSPMPINQRSPSD